MLNDENKKRPGWQITKDMANELDSYLQSELLLAIYRDKWKKGKRGLFPFYVRGETLMTINHAEGTARGYVGIPLTKPQSRDRSRMLRATLALGLCPAVGY